MHDPIDPGLPAGWERLVSGLSWSSVKLGPDGVWLGELRTAGGVTNHMIPEREAAGSARWGTASSAPTGICPVLMTQDTATKLLTGTVQSNGSISVGGISYRVQFYWDGEQYTARTVTL